MTSTTPVSCLLIDGHAKTAGAISRALGGAGMRVVGTATSAKRGLELLERQPADVAVVDRSLPDMDGIELAGAIARSPSPVRAVLCSGPADPGLAGQALAAGVSGLIATDAPPAEVVRAVRTVAAGGIYVDPRLGGPLALAERRPVLGERAEFLLQSLADGLSDEQIAVSLDRSPEAVRGEIHDAVSAIGARNRSHAVALALKTGLIE